MEWPLFDLRLSIKKVALRVVTDADPPAITALFPEDVEQDSGWEHFVGLSSQRNRQRLLVQRTWHPPSRELIAVVVVPGPGCRGFG